MRVVAHMGEIPAPGNIPDRTVDLPRPAVEGAGKCGAVATALPRQQPGTPVGAAVEERLDGVCGGTHDDHGIRSDIVDVGVADIGQVFLAAGPLPGARPQFAQLALKELRRGVALEGDILVTEELITTLEQAAAAAGMRSLARVSATEGPLARAAPGR